MDRFNSNEAVEETPLRIAKDIIYSDTTLDEKVKLIESALTKAENLPISDVSQQRELLKAFLDWQQNKCHMPYDATISSQIEAWEAFNSD